MTTETAHLLLEEYFRFSRGSRVLAQRARHVFPGGDTRASAHYGPYPPVMGSA